MAVEFQFKVPLGLNGASAARPRTRRAALRAFFPTGWKAAAAASLAIFLFHFLAYPALVRDAATSGFVPGFHMVYPFWHLALTPLSAMADALTVLDVFEMAVVILWVFAFIAFLPGARRKYFAFSAAAAMMAWTIFGHRPPGRLIHDDPDVLLVDFHSHTSLSHDGRGSFSTEANRLWHWKQGFDAGFITDHNTIEAARKAMSDSDGNWRRIGYRSMQGEEVSLFHAHPIVLGNRDHIFNKNFDGRPQAILNVIREAHRQGALIVDSLPDYWLRHWDEETDRRSKNGRNNGGTVQDFVGWGMDGFEIINSAPKALCFPAAKRRLIVEFCRKHDLFITGVSDNHGWGTATAAWNAVRIPGWQAMDPETLQAQILSLLKIKKFAAVQVLERVRFAPQGWIQIALSPIGIAWVYLRSLQPGQRVVWVAWIWGLMFLGKSARALRRTWERGSVEGNDSDEEAPAVPQPPTSAKPAFPAPEPTPVLSAKCVRVP